MQGVGTDPEQLQLEQPLGIMPEVTIDCILMVLYLTTFIAIRVLRRGYSIFPVGA